MRTRRLLFEREGYEVTDALGFVAARSSVAQGNFDAVFIGHSVILRDAQQLIREFRERSDAPIVTVRSPIEDWPSGTASVRDLRIIVVGQSPQVVLDAIREATKNRC